MNLSHPFDIKNEVELVKMESQHAVVIISLLMATVLSNNFMEANSKLL